MENRRTMRSFKFQVFVLLLLSLISTEICHGESSKCLMVYKEGGAPAVFQSPKCPRWKLSDYGSPLRTSTCQSSVHQGRRRSQEDRVFCNLDIRVPFPGKTGLTEVTVGIMAVFDGHNGAEASEMASKLLLEYFILHTYFLLDATYYAFSKNFIGWLPNKEEHHDVVFQVLNMDELAWHESLERHKLTLPAIFDGSFRLEIIKKSLLRAIHDIDATFSKEASRYNLVSGSTAAIIVIAEGQILVANVGDSKALLCSQKNQTPAEAKATSLRLYIEKRRSGAILPAKNRYNSQLATSNGQTHFYVEELTNDHHPDRDDEKSRVEGAGGYVIEWSGVPRVNGELAVSRAIGDVSFKRYGVISTPEFTDWRPLSANDSYLVAASDGVFEKLSSQDVCDILWDVHSSPHTLQSEVSSVCSDSSLADCLVRTAFEKGSMDNMAAVLVPLRSNIFSQNLMGNRSDENGTFDYSTELQSSNYRHYPVNGITSEFMQLEYLPVMAKFDQLLVKGNHGHSSYFYLSEKLSEDAYTGAQRGDQENQVYHYDLPQALPESLDHRCGGPLNLYNDHKFCFHFPKAADGARGQCINTESCASFMGFLESIPFHNTGSSYGPFESGMPEYRYKLKKRFGCGAYGEVWLAFHWNFTQSIHFSNSTGYKQNFSQSSIHFMSQEANSSTDNSHAGSSNENLFTLKRIMVEKGTAVYLSGLREKYFGEVFLNATISLGAKYFEDLLMNNSIVLETENIFAFENSLRNISSLAVAVFEEGLNHIARYTESLESRSKEIWLVFRHEGTSLSKLMYTSEEVENDDNENGEKDNTFQVLRPSKWWHWLKTTEAGQNEIREIIWQLLMAIKSCHDRNITHRDIKPENMVICFEDQDTGRCFAGKPNEDKHFTTKMRIIDFGSAIDEFTIKHLYGSTGPSRAEQTSEYTPPEAFLNATWYQGPTSTRLKYDMWSVGVVFLELILGSPNVFQINPLTRSLLDQHLEGWNNDLKELAYKLRSLMELCILVPGSSSKHHGIGGTKYRGGVSPASWKCSEEFFSSQIKSRDPHKLGFPNILAMRLVRQLLLWDPDDRLSVDEALRHPYFQPRPR